MKTHFWKMHGAGNDFVLIDDRECKFPDEDNALVHRLARPKYGVGCEGVILIQPSDTADFRMRFYNPDGGEVEMCGNGARCVARLAHEIGAAPKEMKFDTVAGVIGAECTAKDQVCLTMTPPKDWLLNGELEMEEQKIPFHFVNSGVPHVVMVVEDLKNIDIKTIGAAVRYHPRFQPAGTNVNFIQVTGPDAISVRTYERGVEDETLACGTGMVASGLIAGSLGLVSVPVQITCAAGDVLQVNYTPTEKSAENVTLTGRAVHVFEGEIDLDALEDDAE
ncbi:MAG: diaminopimelate epimerase [Verrucomicrobia bacterium]|nr:diaminopimelate epimerase [Verrucomicrobiota bacterium]MCH8511891.1 diaminopimelate epimerase [Kiritimatiellia bacterium]